MSGIENSSVKIGKPTTTPKKVMLARTQPNGTMPEPETKTDGLETRDIPVAGGSDQENGQGGGLHKQMFVSLNNSFFRTELQLGFLPISTETERLLLSAQLGEQRVSSPDNYYRLGHQQLDLTMEPQYQRRLGDGWDLYARLPLTFRGVDRDDPSSLDLLADLTVGRHWDKHVFRLEYGVNGLGGEGEPSHHLAFTSYQRFNLYQDYLTLRLGAKYSFDFGADYSRHQLTFEGKVGGMIKPDPWVGWGVQFFVPVALDKDLAAGQRRIDLAGVYAWFGSVLPPKVFGPGFFIEGGVWIGGQIDESPAPFRDIIAGIGFKIKYGTEARWWQ